MYSVNLLMHILTKWISKAIGVTVNRQLRSLQNFFGVLSRLQCLRMWCWA